MRPWGPYACSSIILALGYVIRYQNRTGVVLRYVDRHWRVLWEDGSYDDFPSTTDTTVTVIGLINPAEAQALYDELMAATREAGRQAYTRFLTTATPATIETRSRVIMLNTEASSCSSTTPN